MRLIVILVLLILIFGCIQKEQVTKEKNNNIENSTSISTKTDNKNGKVSSVEASEKKKVKEEIEFPNFNMGNIILCNKLKTTAEKLECYDGFIKEKIDSQTPKELLAELDGAANLDPTLRYMCHEVAHAIGRNTYLKNSGDLSKSFEECVQTCHSGCFHGAVQMLFRKDWDGTDSHLEEDEIREKVKTACDLNQEPRFKFQCVHGLGHAVQFYLDNDIFKAVEFCDELNGTWEKDSCYSGAFMENSVSLNKESRHIKADDPHYPCDKLDEKYKKRCYMTQTTLMLEISKWNITKVIGDCKGAGNYTEDCYNSLGRDRSNEIRINKTGPYKDMKKVDWKYQPNYMRGMIAALVDNTWDGFYAFPFCAKLENEQLTYLKDRCYKMATDYLSINLKIEKDKIRESCGKHAPVKDQYLCLKGVK
ncbi:hypothetical protein HYT84_01320 [Candidatus Micrarchaeota archaeon]|nr:hypothetical protein [Candidatus Micrarchaeota archaeon]